jgi:hypothetical protein
MDATITFEEFLTLECRRCGELLADHRTRPAYVPELDAPAAELICPMLVLDLAEGGEAHAMPGVRQAGPGRGVLGREGPGERRDAVRRALPLPQDALAPDQAGARDRLTQMPLQPSPRG